MSKNLTAMYKNINTDSFPSKMELAFYDSASNRQAVIYEKVTWNIEGEERGLRYGENPCQPAALYRPINGNLTFGNVSTLKSGMYLASNVELLQSGKHPGKTNITDADNALNILRYFQETPTVVIVKHNNPCGVAKGDTLAQAYQKAYMADRIAAFGGAIALNRPVDKETAELIASSYSEVVVAPDYEEGVMEIFSRLKNLRVMKIEAMSRLSQYVGSRVIDFKSLIDGGVVVQWSYEPQTKKAADFLPAVCTYKEKEYKVNRQPTAQEIDDMIFGWLIESGVTSNSVLYIKNGVTVGIGTGEQDRVGVAEIARDKAYRKMVDRLCYEKYNVAYALLTDQEKRAELEKETAAQCGGIKGSVMVSDAFFPFRDGIDVGLKEGVSAVIQPGGSLRDFESIEACNEYNAAMVFTGQRSFKH